MAVVSVRFAQPAVRARPLEGFGAQFNTNVCTQKGQDHPPSRGQLADLQATITDLRPGQVASSSAGDCAPTRAGGGRRRSTWR